MTFINLVAPVYCNVKQFGAVGDGVTDDSAAITAAIASLPATIITTLNPGGILYFPPGTYKTSGVVLNSLYNVMVLGAGSASVIAPTSGAIGIYLLGCQRCRISSLTVDGTLYGAATGISINGNFDGRYDNLLIKAMTGDGIFVQGDNPSFEEHYWNSITCRANGGYGYHYQRTTSIDRGSSHFVGLKVLYDGVGTGGIYLESTLGASTIADHWFTDVIVDSYVGTYGIRIKDFVHVFFTSLWVGGTYNSASAILMEGACYGIYFNGLYTINIGSGAGTYDMSINGTSHDVLIENAILDGTASTTAALHVGSTGANIELGKYVLPLSTVPLTDTTSALFNRSYSLQGEPVLFVTNQSTTFGCVGLDDAGNPGKQKWIRNNNGSFQIVNTAYNTTLFRVDDGGYTVVGNTLNLNGFFSLLSRTGAPGTGLGAVGDFYFRQDTPGTSLQRLYVKTASAVWTELLAPTVSATAVAIAASGTIATAGIDVSRVAPTGNVASIVLASGTVTGQPCQVVNESAFTVTFAASGTSHVADGVLAIIAANRKMDFTWDGGTSLWYHS